MELDTGARRHIFDIPPRRPVAATTTTTITPMHTWRRARRRYCRAPGRPPPPPPPPILAAGPVGPAAAGAGAGYGAVHRPTDAAARPSARPPTGAGAGAAPSAPCLARRRCRRRRCQILSLARNEGSKGARQRDATCRATPLAPCARRPSPFGLLPAATSVLRPDDAFRRQAPSHASLGSKESRYYAQRMWEAL